MGGVPTESHGTENPGYIRSIASDIDGFGTWMTRIAADDYINQGIKLTAYVKTTDVEIRAGIWMRIDAEDAESSLHFDNMQTRPITGTTDWQEYQIILDVPENSSEIFFGILLNSTGEALIDGLKLEAVNKTWEIYDAPPRGIASLRAIGDEVVWGGTFGGGYVRTIDGGANWTTDSLPGAGELFLYSIAAIDENTAYFLGQKGQGGEARIYKTVNGGESWETQYINTNEGVFFNAIAFWDEQNGLAVSDPVNGSFVIVRTTNGGEDWVQVPSDNIPLPLPNEWAGIANGGGTCLTVAGTSSAWFGSGNASPLRIFRTTDKGLTWEVSETPLSVSGTSKGIYTIAFKDLLNGYAGSFNFPFDRESTNLVKTNDGGITWTAVNNFPSIEPTTISFVPQTNNSVLFITSFQGSVISRDDGISWEILNTEPMTTHNFGNSISGWGASARTGTIFKFAGNLLTDIDNPGLALNNEKNLINNFPNPARAFTNFQFILDEPSRVKLDIIDGSGKVLDQILNSNFLPGTHNTLYNVGDLPSGLYFYRFRVGNKEQAKRLIILK